MVRSDYIFIGDKKKPFYMIEIIKSKHLIVIYRPDKYSEKEKDFFDRYYLGETYEIEYDKIIYMKNSLLYYSKSEKESDLCSHILPEMIIKSENKYILVRDSVKYSQN